MCSACVCVSALRCRLAVITHGSEVTGRRPVFCKCVPRQFYIAAACGVRLAQLSIIILQRVKCCVQYAVTPLPVSNGYRSGSRLYKFLPWPVLPLGLLFPKLLCHNIGEAGATWVWSDLLAHFTKYPCLSPCPHQTNHRENDSADAVNAMR